MAAILNSGHLGFSHLGFSYLSVSSQTWLTLARIGSHHLHKKNLHSFILTQLDDGSHLEFYCCWIKKTSLSSFLTQTWLMARQDWIPTVVGLRKPSLIHSDSTWWWQSSWILPCWIQTALVFFSQIHSKTLAQDCTLTICTETNSMWPSNSFILTQLDDGSHLEFWPSWIRPP